MNFFDTFINKIPLVSDLSNHFSSIFLKSIPTSWQKLLLIAGATTLTLTGLSVLKRITILLSIFIQHKIHHSKVSAQLIK